MTDTELIELTKKQAKALKLALEALEWINRVNAMDYEYNQKAREKLNAIYEALALVNEVDQEQPNIFKYLEKDNSEQPSQQKPPTASPRRTHD